MDKIIFDTSAIYKKPELLGLIPSDAELIIVPPVEDELSRYPVTASGISYVPLVNDALNAGTIVRANVQPIPFAIEPHPKTFASGSLSGNDQNLLSYAVAYQKHYPADNVYVVTEDNLLSKYVSELKISTIRADDLFAKLTKGGKQVTALAKKLSDIVIKQKRQIWISFFSGVILCFISTLVYVFFNKILATINVWGTLIITTFLPFGFFWWRGRFKLSYGVFEFLIGAMISVRVFLPSFDYSSLNVDAIFILQIIGGIYVMVRGLDNVSKGLRGTKLYPLWSKLFKE